MKLKKKKKKTIAKIHGIGTFAQYVQIKNCWEELQPKTIAALRDDKLFGYVLKRPVYPICLIVTQLGNSSKNGLLFDWLNKQPNDSVVYVSFGSGTTVSHKQMAKLFVLFF